MKTKETRTKKLTLNKLKIASLSREQKNQIEGGSSWPQSWWSICIKLD